VPHLEKHHFFRETARKGDDAGRKTPSIGKEEMALVKGRGKRAV